QPAGGELELEAGCTHAPEGSGDLGGAPAAVRDPAVVVTREDVNVHAYRLCTHRTISDPKRSDCASRAGPGGTRSWGTRSASLSPLEFSGRSPTGRARSCRRR